MSDETEVPLEEWKNFLARLKNPKKSINIGVIGKYVELQDAYKSIAESFVHSGAFNECKVNVSWIHSENIKDENASAKLGTLDGIMVAPGFGDRGIDGKIATVKYARENQVPFFGICLGMQCAVIEFARNVLNETDAHSTEINSETAFPVIDIMDEQKKVINKGGTMRLGAYPCEITKNSIAHQCYNSVNISERHRHRFEFNNLYKQRFEESGLTATGINPESKLVEIIEIPTHPWFVGVQFHPEYKSTVAHPHPLFVGFVNASLKYSEQK